MSRFDVTVNEDVADTVKLINKDWYPGKIVEAEASAGISEKNDTPWVRLTLKVIFGSPEIQEQTGRDEVPQFYTPRIFLDKKGKLLVNSSPELGKLLKLCGISLKDPELKDTLETGLDEAKTLEESLVIYYENIGSLMEGVKLMFYIDQEKNYRDKTQKVNCVSKLAKLPDEN